MKCMHISVAHGVVVKNWEIPKAGDGIFFSNCLDFEEFDSIVEDHMFCFLINSEGSSTLF